MLILKGYSESSLTSSVGSQVMDRNIIPSRSFRHKGKAKKRPRNNSNMSLKFAQIEGIFLRINYGIPERRYRKQQFHDQNITCLVSTAKDENKIKTYKQKAISVHRCKFVLYWQRLTLCRGLTFIVNQKWNNKTFKLRKPNDVIRIIQLPSFRNKRKKNRDRNRERWF